MRRDKQFKRMRQNCDAILLMDRRYGFGKGQVFRDRFGHPQAEDMTVGRGHFDAGNDVKRIAVTVVIRPQAAVEHIVIGDRNHVQLAVLRNEIERVLRGSDAVAEIGMDMQIGASVER